MGKSRLLTVVGILTVVGGIAELTAQTPASPAFEVASVKVNKSDPGGMSATQFQPGGHFVATNVPVSSLIATAFGAPAQALPASRVSGGPSWLQMERFDVDAKASGNPDRAQMLEMLRALLADRFKLTVHNESRDMPMYSLVLARKDGRLGSQLQPAQVDCSQPAGPASSASPSSGPGGRPTWIPRPRCSVAFRPGNVIAGAATMAQISNTLSSVLRQPVRDDTALTGRFDVDLAWTPEQPPRPPDVDPNGPVLFDAIQDQLGLKLQSATGPVDVLVIDSVEHPTPD